MSNKGVTLIEMMIALCIMGIVMAGFYNSFLVQHKVYTAQETIMDMNQVARASATKIVKDLRMAGYKIPGSSLNGIPVATQNTIRVLMDINRDGDASDTDEEVTYAYDAGTKQITRTVNSQAELLCGNVTIFSLSYKLTDGSTTSAPANPANIRKITINFTVESENPVTKTNEHSSINLTFDITPRNMGL